MQIFEQSNGNLKFADGKLVPKGTSILLLYMRLHRNEKFWQDPLKFDPDRFLLEEVVKRNPYSFIPFAAGPRNCIGKKALGIFLTKIL